MKKIKKSLGFLLLLSIMIILFIMVQAKGKASQDDYASQYIYVLDREDKSIVFEKNSRDRAYPASLTKIMTTIIALEYIDDLSEIAPIDVTTYQEMVERNSSMAGFYGRETVTYRDLLYGTILTSGGEAANSLAVNVAGDVESFVRLMNEKVDALGLKDTHFTNPEGMHDDDQFTTAYDMARILDYALDNGHFRAIFTKKSFNTTSTPDHPDGIMLKSTVLSKLEEAPQDDFEILGGKSGTTVSAGECWATLGIKANKEYISIVMGAPIISIKHLNGGHIDDTVFLYQGIE